MTPERFHKIRAVLTRRQPDLTVIAENVYKSHNIAAVIRSCDASGVYCMHAVSPEGHFPKHHMTTAGSGKWVKRQMHPDIESALTTVRERGCRIYAAHLSDDACDYREADYTQPTAFVLGSELTGVSETAAQLADAHVVIPMRGMVESLNVSVANALLLYEAARQREAAGLYEISRLKQEEFDTTLFEWCYPEIAERCRKHNVPYPKLDEDGFFEDNPLPVHGKSAGSG